MARYTDAVCKLCRREGVKLFLKGDRCFTPKCGVERRPYPPGLQSTRRRKVSEYSLQLREKQKARRVYGVLERQFRRHFTEAERRIGQTGENLLRILETRLDNVVFRLGFADSRAQARQFVAHGHFDLNGHKTDIPSAIVTPGDVVTVRVASRSSDHFKTAVEQIGRKTIPNWLLVDAPAFSGRIVSIPERSDIDTSLQEQLIVEFYSR
ncbi:MAG: 30S ribosomal protein S4 [Chloroflexota bacterium]|nr:MAG: 30S ribosomal protein S4 [Chloroflexota bacterium]